MRHGKAVAVLGTEAQRHREVHREPRDPAPLNKRHILSNHATGGRRPDVSGVICARRAAPSPRRHGGTEGHGEGKPAGGPISASDRVLTPSNATSRRALLLSAGAPQVPRTRGRAPGWNRSSRVPLHTSQHDYAGVRTRGVEARRGPPLPSPWSQCPPKPPCQSPFLPVASATHASRKECLLHAPQRHPSRPTDRVPPPSR